MENRYHHIKTLLLSVLVCISAFGQAPVQQGIHAEISSATYFQIPDTCRFQYGPSLAFGVPIYKRNSLGLSCEHVYWEEQTRTRLLAQRVGVVDLHWIRYLTKGYWGVDYVITPNRVYDQDKHTWLVKEKTYAGFIGFGIIKSVHQIG